MAAAKPSTTRHLDRTVEGETTQQRTIAALTHAVLRREPHWPTRVVAKRLLAPVGRDPLPALAFALEGVAARNPSESLLRIALSARRRDAVEISLMARATVAAAIVIVAAIDCRTAGAITRVSIAAFARMFARTGHQATGVLVAVATRAIKTVVNWSTVTIHARPFEA